MRHKVAMEKLNDISDISDEYVKKWAVMTGNKKEEPAKAVKEAVKHHYIKKSMDTKYCEECDKERENAFTAADTDGNGWLNLEEWKKFCVKSCEQISDRLKVKIEPVSEEQMEINFNINRFEGKEGITHNDFLKKADFDKRLTRFFAYKNAINCVSDIPEDYRKGWKLMKPQSHEQKSALKKHYLRKINDVGYRFEAEKERQDAFEKTDKDKNGMLNLNEYKAFCKKSCENISKRIGVTVSTISED